MTDLLKLFEGSSRVSAALNLLTCAIACAWTIGLVGERRASFVLARRGWIAFWIATSTHYLVLTLDPLSSAGFAGLYVATACLLACWDPRRRPQMWPSWQWSVGSVVLVIAVVIMDHVHLEGRGGEDRGAHQLLTAFAIGLWAWRAREVDVAGSLTIAGYALIQLPIHQLLRSFDSPPAISYQDFVDRTYIVYATLKVVVLPSLCVMLADKPRPADLTLKPSA
ncbi:MAG: hypothetical protein ABIY55_06810 [Kofleriaceae bacterium]